MDPLNNQPISSQPAPFTPETDKSNRSMGKLIGILVLILVLIIAAMYLFSSPKDEGRAPRDNNMPATNEQTAVPNSADDLQSLQAELEASIGDIENNNF